MVLGGLLDAAGPFGMTGVASEQVEVGAVDVDMMLGGFQRQDFSHVPKRHGVAISVKVNERVGYTYPKDYFRAIVRLCRKRLQAALFAGHEKLQRGMVRCLVYMGVGPLFHPPARHRPQVFQVGKGASVK